MTLSTKGVIDGETTIFLISLYSSFLFCQLIHGMYILLGARETVAVWRILEKNALNEGYLN
jgi:hypothetical protein